MHPVILSSFQRMPANAYPAIVVAGPTASGKSRLGMALAKKYQGEILSCDALQIYRGMDIGTAKPATTERESVPHHMLDLRMPGEAFSAGDYQRLGVLKSCGAAFRGSRNVEAWLACTGLFSARIPQSPPGSRLRISHVLPARTKFTCSQGGQ